MPINVIYQTAEDGLGDTIKPRLLAAGADCSRVLVIDDQDQPLTMVDARLEEAIIQTKAEERGIKKKTLWNAKKELQIDSVKIGNKWFWMLQDE